MHSNRQKDAHIQAAQFMGDPAVFVSRELKKNHTSVTSQPPDKGTEGRSRRLRSANNGEGEEEEEEARRKGNVDGKERERRNGEPQLLHCYYAWATRSTAVQAYWLPRGLWGCHLCSTTHTSSHNPLPLFTLDQLQRSSTPNYVRGAHSSLCSKVYTSYLTFMSLSSLHHPVLSHLQ